MLSTKYVFTVCGLLDLEEGWSFGFNVNSDSFLLKKKQEQLHLANKYEGEDWVNVLIYACHPNRDVNRGNNRLGLKVSRQVYGFYAAAIHSLLKTNTSFIKAGNAWVTASFRKMNISSNRNWFRNPLNFIQQSQLWETTARWDRNIWQNWWAIRHI